MNPDKIQNLNPVFHTRMEDRIFTEREFEISDLPYDDREIFDYIRNIEDPEYAVTIEELGIVELENVEVCDKLNTCLVKFRPTVAQCNLATLIGLAIKVRLLRLLPRRFKISVLIIEGTHNSDQAINKQLSDKERVASALENDTILAVINECLYLPSEQELPEFIAKILKEKNLLDNAEVKYIQKCRLPIQSYRRWHNILDANFKGKQF